MVHYKALISPEARSIIWKNPKPLPLEADNPVDETNEKQMIDFNICKLLIENKMK